PASIQQPEREGKPTAGGLDRVRNKLQALSDPNLADVSGLRGGVTSTGSTARAAGPRDLRSAPTMPVDPKMATYQKVQSYVGNAIDMTAQTTVLPDKGEIRVKLNPVFQTMSRAQAMPANPLIPGGN